MKYLYLPIETWVREYHSKTLLGVQAASEGWTVIIGPKTAMSQRLPRLPQGTVFQFGLHKNFALAMARLRTAGHKVVAVDEEGLVTLNPKHYKRYRVSTQALNASDACFCWGSVQHEMIRDVNQLKCCPLHITGNPRMDLLRPEFRDLLDRDANTIREKYGKFLLINGNFGSFNHLLGIDYTWKSIKSKGWMSTYEDSEFHHRRVLLQGRIFNAFRAVIPKLVKAGYTVIIRPHPSESLDPWVNLARQYADKVAVIREGNVLPWLQAADVVLHNGCTTAVEAFLLGRPVVAYRPEQDLDLESELPNKISMQATTESELINLLADITNEDLLSQKARNDYIQKHLVGMTGSMSSMRMIDALPIADILGGRRVFESFWVKGLLILRSYLSRIVYRQSTLYINQKCEGLMLEETKTLIAEYKLRLGLNINLQLECIGDGLIKISSD